MEETTALALDLQGVRRSFPVGLWRRRKEVLHGVDLQLPAGARLGLVGPNGSGKSTLLRIVSGVDRASSGSPQVLGGSPLDAKVRRRLAFLPEESPFPAELTAMAVMELLGSLHGMARARIHERAKLLLDAVELSSATNTKLGSYSRGMLRRFGLAQAFLDDPELVLLDEPTAGLDAPGFGVLAQLLDSARERGATVIIASHLLADVHGCDRMALLLDGRVANFGAPAALLAAEGRVELEVEGLGATELEALATWIDSQGGKLIESRPGGVSLLELYRRHSAESGSA
jgi:ABC-2 type transport system ATP-binding protein